MTLTWSNPMAQRVHDEIMALPDSAAQLYAAMVVSAGLQYDLETHHDMIQKRLDDIVESRLATLKEGLLKSYISKRKSGTSVDSLVAAAEAISKAFDPNEYPSWERSQNAREQARDPRGRFRVMNRRINYRWDRNLHGKQAEKIGIPDQQVLRGNKDARKRYQEAYLQVSQLLDQFQQVPDAAGASVHMVYHTPGGPTQRREYNLSDLIASRDNSVDAHIFAEGGQLSEVSVVTPRDLSVQGAAFDLIGAMGASPPVASRAAAALNQDAHGQYRGMTGLRQFGQDWGKFEEDDAINPSNRVYRRVGAGSRLLNQILGPYAPMKVKMATEAGRMVEHYGPEAQKVFGPAADRAAYRYRGVERKPDPIFQNTINSYRNMAAQKDMSPDDARNAMIYGQKVPLGDRPGAESEIESSPVIAYFQRSLPQRDLTHLQRKSGTIPPSQGIIINRKGNVVTQAVGYGDDWYLPFNLKTLSRVKGGEYIRTRTWGGPTTEDIYAGLVTGARAVTVVSHNGVYTIEFDDAFRGSRRYNDKAARMVKRYGQLLDAVKSKEVTLGDIPAERRKEIEDEVRGEGYDPRRPEEKAGYEKLLKDRLKDERENPKMSASQQADLLNQFLDEEALRTLPGVINPDRKHLASQVARNKLGSFRDEMHRQAVLHERPRPNLDEKALYEQYYQEMLDPKVLVTNLDEAGQKRWVAYKEHAQGEYRRSMSPLTLDGSGYDKALKALKEQFPYYIASTRWEQPKPGGFDYGYVKPRFTRPEGALAGYYDPTIGGAVKGGETRGNAKAGQSTLTGKITADRTRFQNRHVMANVGPQLRPVSPEGAQAQAGVPGGAPVSQDASALRRQIAVRALATKMMENPQVWIENRQFALTSPNADGAGTVRDQLKAIAPIYNYDNVNSFMQYWADNVQEGERILTESAQTLKDGGYLRNVQENDIQAVRNPEALRRGREWNVRAALLNPDQTFDFGAEFGPDLTPQQYANRARRMLAQIPVNATLDDSELDTKLTAYIQEQGEILSHVDEPGYRERYDASAIEGQIKRAVQIKQLRRRIEEAYNRLSSMDARRRARDQMEAQRRASRVNTLVTSGEEGQIAVSRAVADQLRQAADQSAPEEEPFPSLMDILRGEDETT